MKGRWANVQSCNEVGRSGKRKISSSPRLMKERKPEKGVQ
jgi:hypothetical protein